MPAPPQTGFNHGGSLSDDPFPVADCFDDLPNFDFEPFEFNDYNFPPPPPFDVGEAFDSMLMGELNGWFSMLDEQPDDWLAQNWPTESGYPDGIGMAGDGGIGGEKGGEGKTVEQHHLQNKSVDGSSTAASELKLLGLVKKTMAPEKLAELTRVDPKRAKRIMANRKSAAKSKEKKAHYINELKERVETLQTEAINLSSHVILIQRDTADIASRNKALKLCIAATKDQVKIRNAITKAFKDKIEILKDETEQIYAITGYPPSYPELVSKLSQLSVNQLQNPPSKNVTPDDQQPQLCMPPPPPPSNQNFSGYCDDPSFSNFNQPN
ncbi:transcription factor VIP1-like [Abrus precatorius]|uniref:Transcription factor VIP1-like n=1 Tax=Abrus precatorius TaxID=3816 RepID=A0A8B8ML90_ABRPR|nr:transcription factor VIP1-like [Abrus precatorius]